MTYEAEVQFKFDATFTPTYGSGFGSTVVDDFIPEEHYLITAPAADLNSTQYFKLFEKFMLCVGMDPQSIRSGAMSLVFNDYVNEEEQRKVCKEYEITMDEDLEKKYQDFKQRDEEWARLKPGPMGTVLQQGEDESSWEERYWALYKRFNQFAKFTDDQLKEMAEWGNHEYFMGND
jgi:hypothetical protein